MGHWGYRDSETLYLFSTSGAIREDYSFQQCSLGQQALLPIETDFNLPSESGSALFVVGKFNRDTDKQAGSANEAIQIQCQGLPEGSTLGVGYMEGK